MTRRRDPAKDNPTRDGQWVCSVCGCLAEEGHQCDKKRLAGRDAAMRRDDDAGLERRRTEGERIDDGFAMLDDNDQEDD